MEPVKAAEELREIVTASELQFRTLTDQIAGQPHKPGKWSRKQILGHLIDSAANNHQRFVRLQLTVELHMPAYEQEGWIRTNAYSTRSWSELVMFWAAYNRHLAHVIGRIDLEHLDNVWITESGTYELHFLITDYLNHLRHHLVQIFE